MRAEPTRCQVGSGAASRQLASCTKIAPHLRAFPSSPEGREFLHHFSWNHLSSPSAHEDRGSLSEHTWLFEPGRDDGPAVETIQGPDATRASPWRYFAGEGDTQAQTHDGTWYCAACFDSGVYLAKEPTTRATVIAHGSWTYQPQNPQQSPVGGEHGLGRPGAAEPLLRQRRRQRGAGPPNVFGKRIRGWRDRRVRGPNG